ncbi:MAG: hypothetical protein HY074_05750 [Deltaproteobacteria bacterium]|nr:hypothetical protein [Deltaproteobacteria bacterium]
MTNEAFLKILRTSEMLVQSEAAWKKYLGDEGIEKLSAAGPLVRMSTSELDGRTETMDFGEGDTEYRIEVRDGKTKVFPIDQIGDARELEDAQLKLFRLERRSFFELIARNNGFAFNETLSPIVERCLHVGTRKFDDRKLHLLALFDESDLCLPGLAAFLRENETKALATVVMLPVQPSTVPSVLKGLRRVAYVETPTHVTAWKISPAEYCKSSLDFTIAEAASIRDDKLVLLDIKTGAIFILGEHVKISPTGVEYKYLRALIDDPCSEHPGQDFAEKFLNYTKHHQADVTTHIGDVRRRVRERFKQTFGDNTAKVEKASELFLSTARRTMVIANLKNADILRWGEGTE